MCGAIVSVLHSVQLDSVLVENHWCFDRVAEAMRYLSSGLASHIHVSLGRDIHKHCVNLREAAPALPAPAAYRSS